MAQDDLSTGTVELEEAEERGIDLAEWNRKKKAQPFRKP